MESQGVVSGKHRYQQNVISVRAPSSINATCDEVKSFENLRQNLTDKLKIDNWIVVTSQQNLYIFDLNKKPNGNLSIRNTVSIGSDLIVKVFGEIGDTTLFKLKLQRWPELQTLIEQLSNVKREDDLHFDCILESDVDEIVQQKDVPVELEFCSANTYDLQDVPTKPSNADTDVVSVKLDYQKDSVLKIESPVPDSEPKNLPTLEDAAQHDPPSPPYICSECGREFDRYVTLMLHHRRVHQPKICSVCNATVTGKMSLHMQEHFAKKSYQCSVCNSTYRYEKSYELHMKSKHNVSPDGIDDGVAPKFFCDICKDGKDFKTRPRFKVHMETGKHKNGTEQEKLQVEHCQMEWVLEKEERMRNQSLGSSCSEKKTIVVEKSDAGDKDNSNNCSTCGKIFSTQKQLLIHLRRHDLSKWKQCPICNKSYDNLTRHINNTHKKIRNYVCDVCGSKYLSSSALKEHVVVKHSPDGEFRCDICENGRVYPSRPLLKRHLARHVKTATKDISVPKPQTNRKKIVKCDLCDQTFTSIYSLRNHTTSKHNTTHLHECKDCSKTFALKSLLKLHEQLHSGKTYVCHECGQSFNHQRYLRKHLVRHKGITKKECTMCDKKYANNVDLRMHMKKVHDVDMKANEKYKNK